MLLCKRKVRELERPGCIIEGKLQEVHGKVYQQPRGHLRKTPLGQWTCSVGGAQAFSTVQNPGFSPRCPAKRVSEREGEYVPSHSGYSGEKSAPPETGAREMYSQQSHLSNRFPYKYF